MNADWVPPTAIVVTGISTAVLAVATWRLVNANNALVRENAKLIAAAEKEAKASSETVEEIKRDRELGYRPHLTWETGETYGDQPGTGPDSLEVANVGRGPALHIVYVTVLQNVWRVGTLASLAPNEHRTLRAHARQDDRPTNILGKGFLCEDALGITYLFHPGAKPPEIFPLGKYTGWAVWYQEEKSRLFA